MAYGNGGAVGAATTYTPVSTPQAVRPTVISEQCSTLESRVESLGNIVAELEARLSMVLMSEAPSGEKASQAPHPGVPLGNVLAIQNDRLHLIAVRLRSLIERVEL